MMEDYKKDLDDYFCRFTFGQFVTLILIEVVTLFFVFYLGARYGTDLLGTTGPKEAVIPSQSPKSVDDIVGAPPVEYTYPEVLTSRDGQKAVRIKPSGMTADEYEKTKAENPAAVIARDTPKPEPREEPVEEPGKENPGPSKSPPATLFEAKTNPPKNVTPPATPATPTPTPTPTAPPTEEETPAPAVEVKPKGKFTVQVGSYQSSEEASASLNSWKRKGYSAFMATAAIPEKGTWYRVRIGGFPTREEAQKFLEKFKTKEKASALVVLSSS